MTKKSLFSVLDGALLLATVLFMASVWSAYADAPAIQAAQPAPDAPFKINPEPFPHPNESWSEPDRSHTNLTPQKPIVLQTDDQPTFVRQLIRVQWRPLDTFEVYVIKPKGLVKPPVVLYLYGYPTDAARFHLNSYCDRITRNGCAAVGFVSALDGDRYRDRPMREWFFSQLNEALSESAHDVQCVLDYLTTRGDLDMTRVGIFGQGTGGSIAILAAGADPRIKSLDLLQPWGDWPDWVKSAALIPNNERPNFLTVAFAKRVAGLDPIAWLPHLKGRHIRIQEYSGDENMPDICQKRMMDAVPPGTIVRQFPAAMSAFGANSGGRMFRWNGEQLGATPVASDPTPPAQNAAAAH